MNGWKVEALPDDEAKRANSYVVMDKISSPTEESGSKGRLALYLVSHFFLCLVQSKIHYNPLLTPFGQAISRSIVTFHYFCVHDEREDEGTLYAESHSRPIW